jgi:DNA-binding NarL/FixJ family response regulator
MASKLVDIFFVEDNAVVRFSLKNFVSRIPDFNLVGEAATGIEAIQQVLALKPEVALVDIGLPDLDGISVTRQIKKSVPQTKVLMLTASDNEHDIFESLDAGADGYVIKGQYSANLEAAIRSVRIGSVWLDPAIAKLVATRAREYTGRQHSDAAEPLTPDDLSRLEKVASSNCQDGVCLVEPEFMDRLRKLNKGVHTISNM